MSFNNGLEKKKFMAEWEIQRKTCEAAGMSAESIQLLFDFEWAQFKRDRTFYEHTETCGEPYCSESDNCIGSWLDEINDAELALRLENLSTADKELLTLIVIDNYTHAEIALEMGVARQQVTKRIARIMRCLKFPHI